MIFSSLSRVACHDTPKSVQDNPLFTLVRSTLARNNDTMTVRTVIAKSMMIKLQIKIASYFIRSKLHRL